MQVGRHHFCSESLEWLKRQVSAGSLSRSALAEGLCERENWVNARGEFCLASARKALPALCDWLKLALPAPRRKFGGSAARESRPLDGSVPDPALRRPLADLGSLCLRLVEGAEDRRLWVAMMEAHHPQGWSRPPGVQVRYWIESSGYGVLGGMGFCPASWHQRARDRYIGWSADARIAHLDRVLNNHRLLILPRVRVRGLASWALREAARILPDDWRRAQGQSPLLLYTYVDPAYAGACYRAAGWSLLEERTSGRSPAASRGSEARRRRVLALPLREDWQQRLRSVPPRKLGRWGSLPIPRNADWADIEYARGNHPDGRVQRRIRRMGRAWARRPGAAIPAIFPAEAERKAAYRLLSNDQVSMEHILVSHQEALAERCALESRVLALQDTSSLNFASLGATEGLDRIGANGKATTQGLQIHVGLVVTEAGRPLGLFELNADYRGQPQKESQRWLRGMDRAGELAEACPNTRVIAVCDQEGDFWNLLLKAETEGQGLLVRASPGNSRWIVVEDRAVDLWEWMASRPPRGRRDLKLPSRGGSKARGVRKRTLEVRAERVEIGAPRSHPQSDEMVGMLAVSATERDAIPGEPPLQWLLLCTEGQATLKDAVQALRWYSRRWTIEEYFRTLKSGCKVEERKPDHADDLRKCLAFDVITACHVFDLARSAREHPEQPSSAVASQDEIDTLRLLLEEIGAPWARSPPGQNPDTRTFVIGLGRIVGFQPSRRQPLPGVQKVWEGNKMLKLVCRGFQLAKNKTPPTTGSSVGS